MPKKYVTKIVPAVKTWWGGEPVKVKFTLLVDKSDCTLEIIDSTIIGWGVDNTVTLLDVSLGVSFDLNVYHTEEIEECEAPSGTCKKTIVVQISGTKTTTVLGKEFTSSIHGRAGAFSTSCLPQCCG